MFAGGHIFYLAAENLVVQEFDARTRRITGDPRTVAKKVLRRRDGIEAAFGVANDVIAYVATGFHRTGQQLTLLDRSGREIQQLGEPAELDEMSLSPDGRTLAMTVGDPSDRWLLDLERGARTRLTYGSESEAFPRWRPDGRALAFVAEREGREADACVRPAGPGAESALLADPAWDEYPNSWSPDGKYLVFARGKSSWTQSDLWIMPAGGGEPHPIVEGPFVEWDAHVSPDGR